MIDYRQKKADRRVSPAVIEHLQPGEIFVFGSNLQGMHGGGAARVAYRKFGARMGCGVGLQGQSYAIPTMQGGVETIRPYVDDFIRFAQANRSLKFLVTRIGCGIAGFRDEEIAPLFKAALQEPNIWLPQEFIDCLVRTKPTLLGAVAGDVIGSVYEFNPTHDYHFPLLQKGMMYTDDTIITIAVADWLLNDPILSTEKLARIMRKWGRKYRYPMGGYGGYFDRWLDDDRAMPYNSWGNGSAMRVSAVGFAFDSLEDTLIVARRSAEVTHNHPEGIKGAQATAAAIFMARTGRTKEEIRKYVSETFGYDLHRTCDDIRPTYKFEGSCQETVPQSLIAFFDSTDYESAIRLTVSLGGDADTMGAITGSVAAAYYGKIPAKVTDFVMQLLPQDMTGVIRNFEQCVR